MIGLVGICASPMSGHQLPSRATSNIRQFQRQHISLLMRPPLATRANQIPTIPQRCERGSRLLRSPPAANDSNIAAMSPLSRETSRFDSV